MALSEMKPRELSIKEKVMVIKQNESEGKSQRELVKIFGVSKTQIQNTLKTKADVLAAYKDNLPNDRKRVRILQFKEDFDSLTFRWFQSFKDKHDAPKQNPPTRALECGPVAGQVGRVSLYMNNNFVLEVTTICLVLYLLFVA